MNKSEVGKIGEKIAANYLQENGHKILGLNYYNNQGYRMGEIDIIGEEIGTEQLVFFEVKTRVVRTDGVVPEENITKSKLDRLFKAINYFLQKEELLGRKWRLDSIGVLMNLKNKTADLRHIKAIRY